MDKKRGSNHIEMKKGHVEVGPGGQKLLHCPHEGCDKVLTSSPGLRYHMRTHYGNDRPYHCTRCKKTFKSANGLKYHTEKTKCEVSLELPVKLSPTNSHRHRQRNYEESVLDDEEVDVVSTSQPVDIQRWRQRTISESSGYLTISPLPYQSGLSSPDQEDICDPLTQLAIIATGPQSPLIHQQRHLTDFQRASQSFNASIHSYAKPPIRNSPVISRKRSLSFSGPDSKYSCSSSIDSSESDADSHAATDEGIEDSSISSTSPDDFNPLFFSSDEESDDYNETEDWPAVRWQCFIPGTKVRFENSGSANWIVVGENELKESFAPYGLKLVQIISESPLLHLKFRPFKQVRGLAVISLCQRDHPFFVKDKGWCSCYPTLSESRYGLQCNTLVEDDICLPPHHNDAKMTRRAIHKLNSYQFTPEDTNAVYALSQLAAQSRAQSRQLAVHKPTKRSSKKKSLRSLEDLRKLHTASVKRITHTRTQSCSSVKAKRPMNAFMLFAKKFRLEYTAQYPGKDNRAISVMLGEKWKRLKKEERKVYSEEAKGLADQYKKQNPDCWKRKRSVSESMIS